MSRILPSGHDTIDHNPRTVGRAIAVSTPGEWCSNTAARGSVCDQPPCTSSIASAAAAMEGEGGAVFPRPSRFKDRATFDNGPPAIALPAVPLRRVVKKLSLHRWIPPPPATAAREQVQADNIPPVPSSFSPRPTSTQSVSSDVPPVTEAPVMDPFTTTDLSTLPASQVLGAGMRVETPPDLALNTRWYLSRPPPVFLANREYVHSHATRGTTATTRIVLRQRDLSTIHYSITCDTTSPDSPTIEAHYTPSPIYTHPPSTGDLEAYAAHYGTLVLSWVQAQEGKVVKTGECWDVAQAALESIKDAMPPRGRVLGYPILDVEVRDGVLVHASGERQKDAIRPGDLLQMCQCTFVSAARVDMAGFPDHTAVVVQNESGRVSVLEQGGERRFVHPAEYDLGDLSEGRVTVYRPMPVEWAPELAFME